MINRSTDFESARNNVMDADNEINKVIDKYSTELTKEFDVRLKEVNETFKKEHKITLPKVDLYAIVNDAKKGLLEKKMSMGIDYGYLGIIVHLDLCDYSVNLK